MREMMACEVVDSFAVLSGPDGQVLRAQLRTACERAGCVGFVEYGIGENLDGSGRLLAFARGHAPDKVD